MDNWKLLNIICSFVQTSGRLSLPPPLLSGCFTFYAHPRAPPSSLALMRHRRSLYRHCQSTRHDRQQLISRGGFRSDPTALHIISDASRDCSLFFPPRDGRVISHFRQRRQKKRGKTRASTYCICLFDAALFRLKNISIHSNWNFCKQRDSNLHMHSVSSKSN